MKDVHTTKLAFAAVAASVVGSLFVLSFAASGQDKGTRPEITITSIPPSGEGGPDKTAPIAGTVKGVDFRAYRVIVYAFADNQWWVQPTTASPRTPIGQNGNWETDTHLGRRYAAVLATPSFKPKNVGPALPDEDGKEVLAIDEVAGKR
jgi:hypothetical protein